MAMRLKRVYEDPAPEDGFRVLIDRLWPRGLSTEKAAIDLWCKDVAPSTELRTWFGHRQARFAEFTVRYRQELEGNPLLEGLRTVVMAHATVTLLYGVKDQALNHAVILIDYL
jgi:DNA-3-methyladenine glycosylase